MASDRLPLIPLLLAPFGIWHMVQRIQRYRAARAAGLGWTPVLRAERWAFRGMGWMAVWLVFAVSAMVNPTTPNWLMTGIWCGVGLGAVVWLGASLVSGIAQAGQRRL